MNRLAALEIPYVASTAEPSSRRQEPLTAGSRNRAFHFFGTENYGRRPVGGGVRPIELPAGLELTRRISRSISSLAVTGTTIVIRIRRRVPRRVRRAAAGTTVWLGAAGKQQYRGNAQELNESRQVSSYSRQRSRRYLVGWT
jgi:hypothetical protein